MKKTLYVILGVIAALCCAVMFYFLFIDIENIVVLTWAKQAAIPAVIALLCGWCMGKLGDPDLALGGKPQPQGG